MTSQLVPDNSDPVEAFSHIAESFKKYFDGTSALLNALG